MMTPLAPPPGSARARNTWIACFVLIALVRLATLGTPALLDTTEGRYGAVALRMLDSGDWVTPQVPMADGFEPYLGKPPLHFWMMAAAMAAFGKNEFAARLPSFVMGLLMVALTMAYARRRFGSATALLSGLVLSTTALFFFAAGSVNVDLTLAAFVQAAVVSFCRVADVTPEGAGGRQPPPARWWGCCFFVALGLGTLTKGPVALALTGAVGISHLVVFRDWRIVTRLPWIGGGAVFLALVVPWFWLNEARHPDFLRYFLLSENLGRFATSDYGDRYGSGRTHFRGSIWAYWLAASLPWIALPLVAMCRRAAWVGIVVRGNPAAFLLLWAMSPALLFMFTPQFTAGYLLPGTGALSVLVARWLGRVVGATAQRAQAVMVVMRVTMAVIALLAVLLGGFFLATGWVRGLLAAVLAVGLLSWVFERKRAVDALAATRFTSIVGVGFYLVLLLVSARYASGARSVAPILAHFLAVAPTGEHTVGLLSNNSYSAYFYGPAWAGDTMHWQQVTYENADATRLGDLFVNKGGLSRLSSTLRSRYHVAAESGSWVWLTGG